MVIRGCEVTSVDRERRHSGRLLEIAPPVSSGVMVEPSQPAE